MAKAPCTNHKQSHFMACVQAVSQLETVRGTGGPLGGGKPTGHVLLAMASPSGSKDEVPGGDAKPPYQFAGMAVSHIAHASPLI